MTDRAIAKLTADLRQAKAQLETQAEIITRQNIEIERQRRVIRALEKQLEQEKSK